MIKFNIYKQTRHFINEISRSKIIFQAILVGIFAGLLVVLFRLAISGLFSHIADFVKANLHTPKMYLFPLITTLGGLVSGILVWKFAPETKGSGIPYVKMALTGMGKFIRLRSIFVKFFAGVAGIGTGLSLGREGPSVQLGAGAGEFVGKFFKMKGTDKDKLIAAGAGSAIAATFNAPIAGTIFVLEELVNNFSSSLLFPVLIATVSADTLSRYILGNTPCFVIPPISSSGLIDIPAYIILGIAAAIIGVLFSKTIFFNNKMFSRMNIPNFVKPAIAGLLVGIIGLAVPLALGSGNTAVDVLLGHKLQLGIVLVIFITKFFLTPLCFGSGAAGGIFLPTLMLGAFLGYITASLINLTGFHIDPAMLIVNDAAKTGEAKSLSEIKVRDAMNENVEYIETRTSLHNLKEIFETKPYSTYPVLNSRKKLCGYITKSNINDLFLQGTDETLEIEKIMNPNPITVLPDENLYVTYYRLHANNVNCLFVVDRLNNLKGIITRKDIFNKLKEDI